MIKTEKQYNETLQKIDLLMKKGEENITKAETDILKRLISQVSDYEDETIKLPATCRK